MVCGEPLSSWDSWKIRREIKEVTPKIQEIVPVLRDAVWCRVWCRLRLVGLGSACRAGLDKEAKEVFKDCKEERKRSFWHLVSHSILRWGAAVF